MKHSSILLLAACLACAATSPAAAAPTEYSMAQADLSQFKKKKGAKMSPKMAAKIKAGWKAKRNGGMVMDDPLPAQNSKKQEKEMAEAGATLTQQAIDEQAAKMIRVIMNPDGTVQGVEGAENVVLETMEEVEEPDPYRNPKVMPVQAAPRVYTPPEDARYQPNRTNKGGGIGAVGGLGRVGSPNVR